MLFVLTLWDNEVKHNAHNSSQADTAQGNTTEDHLSTTDAKDEDKRCNNQVASIAEVYLILNKAVDTNRCDSTK